MSISRKRSHTTKPMAEINVTPLVDVMLVLLIIFMVTAPMLSMGIDVNLPKVKSKSVDVAEEKLVLTINESKEIFLNKTKMPLGDLNAKLESYLGFLATTGSASPFIGLFGTVWGIMDTFKGIGARGTATLAVVAPGISEALIATAAGLAAAIPAVIFYNYFLNQSKDMVQEMENFASEFLNIVERHFRK